MFHETDAVPALQAIVFFSNRRAETSCLYALGGGEVVDGSFPEPRVLSDRCRREFQHYFVSKPQGCFQLRPAGFLADEGLICLLCFSLNNIAEMFGQQSMQPVSILILSQMQVGLK